ncbi:MAG TPA: aspartyl protease [Cyanobacteria bacterium UBA12227]|nr:aspartyl protease [Cyanobacteria bacterium UBA12227]HAX87257.1 aspartyl protease [Cyanobacteria bacterium UBA11370]HBY81039.1 aspartyl protease [Cyanobacteria bacterium UBA11148]
MIQGKFGEEDELFFEIELISAEELELPVDAMLDTGFSGWLAIDNQDVEGLGWSYLRKEPMRMAQGGDSTFNLHVGKVRIDGQEFDIPVHAGEGVPEILIGRQWLKTRRLLVDMTSGVLTLGS